MKGQSAVEYLATYGWMALAVSVSGAAIYSGVNTGGCGFSAEGIGNQEVSLEKAAIAENQLALRLKSNSLSKVEIQSINVTNEDINRVKNAEVDGDGTTYILANAEKSDGTCKELNTQIIYSTEYIDNLGTEVKLNLPVENLEQLIVFLKRNGGSIPEINSTSTIRPTNETICFGDKCETTEGEEKPAPQSYTNRSGDTMTGTLRTQQIQFECAGNQCQAQEGSLSGYLNKTQNNIDGTLNTTEIKPINEKICLGDQKCN